MQMQYQPIGCAQYERYELAIMHRDLLRVAWRARAGATRLETLRPFDLRTRAGAEYLLARTLAGAIRVLRLDRIVRAETLTDAAATGRPA